MEKNYYNDAARNYMVIRVNDAGKTGGYQYRMISENRIEGLLSCSIRQIDGESYLYYDITSMQSLDRLFGNRNLTGEVLKEILFRLAQTGKTLTKYLLDSSRILLAPDMIYYSFESSRFFFAYYPQPQEGQSLMHFLSFARSRVVQEDKETIYVIYWLMDKADNPNFILREEILNRAFGIGGKEPEDHGPGADPQWQQQPHAEQQAAGGAADPGWSQGKEPEGLYADYFRNKPEDKGEDRKRSGRIKQEPEFQEGAGGEQEKRSSGFGFRPGRKAEKPAAVPAQKAQESEKADMANTLILALVFLLAAIADELVNLYVPLQGRAVLFVRIGLIVFLGASVVTAAIGTVMGIQKKKREDRTRQDGYGEAPAEQGSMPKIQPAQSFSPFEPTGENPKYQGAFAGAGAYGNAAAGPSAGNFSGGFYGGFGSGKTDERGSERSRESSFSDRSFTGAFAKTPSDTAAFSGMYGNAYGHRNPAPGMYQGPEDFRAAGAGQQDATPSLVGVGRAEPYRILLDALPCTVGSSPRQVSRVIQDPSIGRVQAGFSRGSDGRIRITDLQGSTGTFLNGVRLMTGESLGLERGDEIRLGNLSFIFR